MEKKTWTANDNQKAFLEVLENYPNGVSLKDIELDTGKVFKTGCINTLVKKGLVETIDGEFKVDLVYRGVVISQNTKTWKLYKLVQ